MIRTHPHADIDHMLSQLRGRWAELGVVLLRVDEEGRPVGPQVKRGDWLGELLVGSGLFINALRQAAERWRDQEQPQRIETAPGLWLCPNAVIERRQRAGYVIAVIPCVELLGAEQLEAMCQGAGVDCTLLRTRLQALPPAASCDVPRLHALVDLAQEDRLRMTSEDLTMQSVGQQLAESYEEINLLYTIIQNMTVRENPETFIKLACDELLHTLPYKWIATQLGDDSVRQKRLRGRLIVAGQPPLPIAELRMVTRQLLSRAEPNKPIILNEANSRYDDVFAELGTPIVLQPVSNGAQLVGIVIAGQKQGHDPDVSSVDLKLLDAAASHMGIFLENASLYNDLNGMFLGTLEALTSAIDAKDKYTCGHSRRVADLTRQLAYAIGLDDQTAGRMHIAGLVHDVGKIGVPEAVLTKAGRLTDAEFAWIRMHPQIGYRILKDIPQLEDVLPGVLHHHERWDGRGYPSGLRGDEIPLVGRLIALADSFDAMSSTRTYRKALRREEVLTELLRCGGTQFDPDLVATFVELDFAHYDALVEEHQAAEPTQQRLQEAADDAPPAADAPGGESQNTRGQAA